MKSYLVKYKEGRKLYWDFIEAISLDEAWRIAGEKYGRSVISVGLFKG